MQLIHFRIKPHTSFVTDWASDTLFGALCWMCLYRYGEAKLKELLHDCAAGSPPIVLSNAFPAGLFPKPLHFRSMDRLPVTTLADISAAKKASKAAWLDLSELNDAINGIALVPKHKPRPFLPSITLHNQLSRLTNRTGDHGQLFTIEEVHLNTDAYPYLSIFARVQTGWENTLAILLADLGHAGVGQKATTGKGGFEVLGYQVYTGFKIPANANGFVTLGVYVPARQDPLEGYYKLEVRRGRLGLDRSRMGNPFKKPLLRLLSGAVFYTDSPYRGFAGRLVGGLSPSAPDVVSCGISLTLPMLLSPSVG